MKQKLGIPVLTPEQSNFERLLFREFEDMLVSEGFQYISIPSSIQKQTFILQGVQEILVDGTTLTVDEDHDLSGSAEQGILEYFQGKKVEPGRWFAVNQCWRDENTVEGFLRCKEFRKIEQFSFVKPEEWELEFFNILGHTGDFLDRYDLDWRLQDCTKDPGHHVKKIDIQVLTDRYGWMETHSCTYYGDDQVSRFDIEGGVHTISNTGLASPRILIPLMEKGICPS